MKRIIIIFSICAVITFFTWLILKNLNKHITATEMMNERKHFTEDDARKAIIQIQKEFGKDMAKTVEKIMRLETRHFKSGQYQLTGSAGMEVGKWKDIPVGATDGYITMSDADKTDGDDDFIVWHSVTDFARYLANYIRRYNGNWARWNSTNPTQQAEYKRLVNSITSRFVV